jgi:hypothetical protein
MYAKGLVSLLERAEWRTSCLEMCAKPYARGLRRPLGKERESFCQRRANLRNTCLIGSYSQSIPSGRRFCDDLPSKQAVAGSSPVSRSYLFNYAS